MTEPLSNLNISPWQFLGVIVIAQVLLKTKTNGVAITRLGLLFDELNTGAKNVICDFPVIALTGGFTYIAHQLIPARAGHLLLSTLGGAEGSLKVAAFVSGVFALKAAFSTYFQTTLDDKAKAKFFLIYNRHPRNEEDKTTHADLIREGFIHNFLPLAIGCFAAYYASIPIRLTQCAIYTASLMGIVKLLGKGFEYFLALDVIYDKFQDIHSWLNMESPLEAKFKDMKDKAERLRQAQGRK